MMTLYQIEDGLAQLIAHRAERLADKSDPPDAEELATLDSEINKYQIAEPAKVARVAAMFRMWKAQRANIKDEIARLRDADAFLDACEARLKDRVAAALELLPEPAKGCRKLNGAEGSTLSLKKNGGVEPLEITMAAAIPDELCIFEGYITGPAYKTLSEQFRGRQDVVMERKPHPGWVRAALARGDVPGARLLPRSNHVECK